VGGYEVPSAACHNPYLFRDQERALFERGRGPLSVVRDMIGSQSTKGMHFVRAIGARHRQTGVWMTDDECVTVIETYAPRRQIGSASLKSEADRIARVLRTGNVVRGADTRDAVMCALVAGLFVEDRTALEAPAVGAAADEGWIWLPRVDATTL
jgi:hypothetical protein